MATMAAPLAHWGPDGGGTWIGEGAGLGVLVAHRTPEAVHEGGPVAVAGGRVTVVAQGRLDNRDELLADLAVGPSARPITPDGWLIASAYERWGEGAVGRLLGDWSFAAYDATNRRLLLARDHFGQTGIQYHFDGRTFAFASGLKGLFALDHVAVGVNELRLAQHLVVWPTDGAATLYQGISRLPPAHVLTFDGNGLRTREYWRPEDAPEVRLASDDDYVERFVELFAAAVRARLRSTGHIASTLSAGLDSAGVTALAATELEGTGRRLTAFTSTPAFPEIARDLPGKLVDEWPGAQLVAQRYPSTIEHVAVSARDVSPIDAMNRFVDICDEPPFGVGNAHWMVAMLDRCRENGAGVLLTGQMGNGGVSWEGERDVVLRRLLRGDVAGAGRELAVHRTAPGMSWPRVVRREVAGPVRRRVVDEVRRRRLTRSAEALGPLIAPELAARLDLRRRQHDEGFARLRFPLTDAELRVGILLPGISHGGAIYEALGAAHGLDVRDPTGDVRLLEFCFGVPANQFRRGDCDRWLMRRGFQRHLPAPTLANRRRGTQGADLAYRLRADGASVTRAVSAVVESPFACSYLDGEGMQARWVAVGRGGGDPGPAFQLLRGLSFGRYLAGLQ